MSRAPPISADRAGPAGSLAAASPAAAAARASPQLTGDQLAVLADQGLDEAAVLEATGLAGLAEELAAAHAEADHLGGGGRRHVDGLVGQLRRQRAGVDLVAVDRLEGEPALVAQPAVVDRVESMPSSRVSRLADDCTATRQPTEQVVQVDSTWSRSQGRAVKR